MTFGQRQWLWQHGQDDDVAYTYEYEHDPGVVLSVGDLRRALDGIADETPVMMVAARSPGEVGAVRQVAVSVETDPGGVRAVCDLPAGTYQGRRAGQEGPPWRPWIDQDGGPFPVQVVDPWPQ